jgi:hypothetical protein
MSSYLQLAKKAIEEAPAEATQEKLEEERLRKREEASRRGLIIHWSEYPDWIKLHNPLSGEWHEVKASECLPGVLETVNKCQKKGGRA